MTSSRKDVRSLGRKGVINNVDNSGQGQGGGSAVCGHPFRCGFWKREEGILKSLYRHLPVLEIGKTKRHTRNKCSMYVIFKDYYFSIVFAAL